MAKRPAKATTPDPEKDRERVRGSAGEVIPQEEKALVEKWQKLIKARLKCKDFEQFHKAIPEWRTYARGRQYSEEMDKDEQKHLVRANLIYSTMVNAVPQIYARNPQIDVDPTESVLPIRYEAIKKFCSTLSIILNNQFSPAQANLKARAKANIMSTQTTAWGILKVLYQRDIVQDPIIKARMEDIQDNIKHVERLIKDIEDETQRASHEAMKEELKHQLMALEQKVEVVRQEGLVIDRVLSENLIISSNVRELGSYLQAEWMAESIYGSRDWAKDMFGFAPEKATTYVRKGEGYQAEKPKEEEQEELCIWEIWHRKTNTIYTICEGYSGYMREPYHPTRLGERWYPYFILAFNPVDGTLIPLSDVEMLRELQDEYNETRTNLREHRRWSIPHWVGLKGSISKADAKALRDAEPFELVLIEGDEGKPLRQYLEVFQNPPLDVKLYDTSAIRVDWELISGQPDAARGVVAKAKTLGEAEYLQQGMATRMNDRVDINEDMMRDMAQYAAEILLQELTPEQVQRIAGPGAIWPRLTKDEVFDMVSIRIRAGSSGKPDKRLEQEVWMQFLPLLTDAVMKVLEARKLNDHKTADTIIKLMEETMRRFDERLDINAFFPQREEEGEVDPEQLMLMQQQNEAARKQLELMDAQIMELKSKVLKNVADAEAAEVGAQFDAYQKIIETLQQGLMNPAAPGPASTTPPAMMMQ